MKIKLGELPATTELPSEEEILFPVYETATMSPTRCISFKDLISAIRKVLESDGSVVVEEKIGRIIFSKKRK